MNDPVACPDCNLDVGLLCAKHDAKRSNVEELVGALKSSLNLTPNTRRRNLPTLGQQRRAASEKIHADELATAMALANRQSDAVMRYGGHDVDCNGLPGLDNCCACGWSDVLVEARRIARRDIPDDGETLLAIRQSREHRLAALESKLQKARDLLTRTRAEACSDKCTANNCNIQQLLGILGEPGVASCTLESCAPECVRGELPCPFAQGRGRKSEPRFCGYSACGDRGGPAEACGKELPGVDHPLRLSKYEHDRFCVQCGAEQPCATHCRYRAIQAETGIWFLWRCVDHTWETIGQVEVVTLATLGDLADLKR